MKLWWLTNEKIIFGLNKSNNMYLYNLINQAIFYRELQKPESVQFDLFKICLYGNVASLQVDISSQGTMYHVYQSLKWNTI